MTTLLLRISTPRPLPLRALALLDAKLRRWSATAGLDAQFTVVAEVQTQDGEPDA